MVLEAIKQSKTNLKVILGIYHVFDDAVYQRQKTALKEALQTYSTSNVLGIRVDYMTTATANDTNALVRRNVGDIRQMLTSINITLPISFAAREDFNNTFNYRDWEFRCPFIIPQRLTTRVADLF